MGLKIRLIIVPIVIINNFCIGQTSQKPLMTELSFSYEIYEKINTDVYSLGTGLQIGVHAYINSLLNLSLSSNIFPKFYSPNSDTFFINTSAVNVNTSLQFKSNGTIFPEESLIAPYFNIGLGFSYLNSKGFLTVPASLGFRVRMTKSFNFNIQATYKYSISKNPFQSVSYNVGFIFVPPAPGRRSYPMPKPERKEPKPLIIDDDDLVDSDGDGVIDRDDLCPDIKGMALYLGCPEESKAEKPEPIGSEPQSDPIATIPLIEDLNSISIDSIIVDEQSITKIEELEIEIHDFPWLPPPYSAIHPIPDSIFRRANYLRDVKNILASALEKTGYGVPKFYKVPKGFAMLSRVEQIDKAGIPLPEPDRWVKEISWNSALLSLVDKYLSAIFPVNKGHFRMIVFIVTPKIMRPDPKKSISRESAYSSYSLGASSIPGYLENIKFDDSYSCLALIYEYELLEYEKNARFVPNSKYLGLHHLESSGLWKWLLIQQEK